MAKKKAKKKAVAKKNPGTAVVSAMDRLQALAQEEGERKLALGGTSTIKLARGKFQLGGEDLGDQLDVVVVDFVRQKNYFDAPFDEDNPSSPACFALSATGFDMEPHDTAPDPQSETCEGCWANEFGSDSRGKGKACRDSYLMAVLHQDDLEVEDPVLAYLRVPPTSLANWDSYAEKRRKVLGLPAMAFVTSITFDDTVDYQKLLFEEAGRTPETDEIVDRLFTQRELAHEVLMTPPDTSNYETPGSTKAKKKTKKKTKKKASKKKAKKSRFS